MVKVRQILPVISSLITIGNFVFSLPASFPVNINIPLGGIFSYIQKSDIVVRVVFIIVLETIIAYFFGFIFGSLVKFKKQTSINVILIPVATISAYVTLFNVANILIITDAKGFWGHLGFLAVYSIFAFYNCYWVGAHVEENIDKNSDDDTTYSLIQAFLFIIVFILFCLR